LDKGKNNRVDSGDDHADIGYIVEQKGQENPEHRRIHAKDREPYPDQNTCSQADPRLDDHIALNIINEPRELGKCLQRITEDSAESKQNVLIHYI